MKHHYGHWDTTAVGEFDPAQFFGFIYTIEERDTGRLYVGKKQLRFKRKKTKKDKSRTKDSDWRDYTSSSVLVNDLIAERGKDAFAFRIVRLCSGRCELGYTELEECFARDVLRATLPDGTRRYFNGTIGYKNYAGLATQTTSTRCLLRGESPSKPLKPGRKRLSVLDCLTVG